MCPSSEEGEPAQVGTLSFKFMHKRVPQWIAAMIAKKNMKGPPPGEFLVPTFPKAGVELCAKGGETTCFVYDSVTKELLATGTATCSLSDQFCKKTGNAKAKGRAIRALKKSEAKRAKAV